MRGSDSGHTLFPYLHEGRVPVHFRRQFREGLVARLKAGVPLIEGRVFASRPFGPAPGESPCILVFTPSDAPALQERGKRRPMRRDVVANMLVYAREISISPGRSPTISRAPPRTYAGR